MGRPVTLFTGQWADLPLEVLARHGCPVEDVEALRFTPAFREAMCEMVEVARNLFHRGLPLSRMVNPRLSLDLELFSRGGLAILDRIQRQDYDVLSRRPRIGKPDRVLLLLSTLLRWAIARAA